jgi:hypothetical protein
MPSYDYYARQPAPTYTPHGDQCGCDVCAGKRLQNQERLSSTDRLAWCEQMILSLQKEIANISKGNNSMGYALWCQPGNHPFDENEEGSKRLTTDKEDGKGRVTEITVHVCAKHAGSLFQPRKKSLKEIEQEIADADVIDD